MKKSKKPITLLKMLLISYSIFTLVVIIIGIAGFCAWNYKLDKMLYGTDWDKILASDYIKKGEYDRLKSLISKDAGESLAIVDYMGNILYTYGEYRAEPFTQRELECINDYSGNSFYSLNTLSEEKGTYLLTENFYNTGRVPKVNAVTLKKDTTGYINKEKNIYYTYKEMSYLIGTQPNGYQIFKAPIDDERYLIIYINSLNENFYKRAYLRASMVWFYTCCVGIGLLIAFLIILSRQLLRPLGHLHRAIIAYSKGESFVEPEVLSPLEVNEIEKSFSTLVAELEKSKREKERLDKSKQQMLADISHDLRTPITVIEGYAAAINQGKIPKEQVGDYLKLIENKASHLGELIELFHQYNKTEHPSFVLDKERVDFCEFLRRFLIDSYGEIEGADLKAEIDLPEEPMYTEIDKLQFTRVLDNILSNIIKHGKGAECFFAGLEAKENSLVLTLKSDGEPVPEEIRDKLFEPFVTGDKARGGGSGLGLAITKNIVNAHGGRIYLDDEGRGFVVELMKSV